MKLSADELTDQLDGQRNVAPLHFVNEDVYDEIKFAIFYDCRRFVSTYKEIYVKTKKPAFDFKVNIFQVSGNKLEHSYVLSIFNLFNIISTNNNIVQNKKKERRKYEIFESNNI